MKDVDAPLPDLIDQLLREIEAYLVVVDAFRSEDLEPEWAAE
jgi:hypothetical protein